MIKLAVLLIAAHLIGDFALQPDGLARRKAHDFKYLLLHGLIMAAVAYLCLQAWTCWQAPLYVLLAHVAIDLVKRAERRPTEKAFLLDQTAHLVSLLLLAWLLVRFGWLPEFDGGYYRTLVMAAGFVATVWGSGFYIGRFSRRLTVANNFDPGGLGDGGRYIGQLERALIFLLVFIGQPAGIGFLVAAKSILRFGGGLKPTPDPEDLRQQQMHAEYVLIGTLLSFSLAIALAKLTEWAAGL